MTNQRSKLAQQIIAKAMAVSADGYSVFVNYSPHIDAIGLRIYTKGWNRSSGFADIDKTVYLDKADGYRGLNEILSLIDEHNPVNIEKAHSRAVTKCNAECSERNARYEAANV